VPTIAISYFVIDVPTLCAVTVFIILTGGLLLLCSWLQNRSETALALWGLAYLFGAVGGGLMALGGLIPAVWTVCGPPVFISCAYGVMWSGARCFEGRRIRLSWMIAGAVIWLVACLFDGFYQSVPARSILTSVILATYALLSAREVWYARQRELASRWPTFAILVMHAGFLLARIPFVGTLRAQPGENPHSVAVAIFAFEALFTIFCLAILRVNMSKEKAELQQRAAARTDALTGVANRRAFFDLGEPLLERTTADRRSSALLLFDLDRFKEINDTAGHQAGDRVLSAFSDLVVSSIYRNDLFARIGGEEFACLMFDTSMQEAQQTAEHIRQAFAAMTFPDVAVRATVSIGVAMASDAGRGLPALLGMADRALYRAKADGRNCVARAPLVVLEGRVGEGARQTA
jgi:diguanylate cyclase (GGDEF)-like protein